MNGSAQPIRVKILGKSRPGDDARGWAARFPFGRYVWGNCRFIFDRHCRDYDWLVVYDDLPSAGGERHTLWTEELACPRDNTLLITSEPSTIKVYGSGFLKQFGWVLTSQEPWVIRHPGTIRHQPGLVWYYAHTAPRCNYENIATHVPLEKTRDISAVCSTKQQRHTLHRKRFDFIMGLKQQIPSMELFGRGIRYIEDKADALDAFRYHVAIENFYGPHHWTEKLADPFLGACMPVYHGCPNAEDYFPSESFLRIDIADLDRAAEIIRRAIADKIYEKNLSSILESRRLVLEKYAPVAQISRIVEERHPSIPQPPSRGEVISSRHALRRKNLFNGISFAAEKTYVSGRHMLGLA
jgi:hypothetical protein